MEANSAHNLVSKEAYSTTKFLTYLIMVSAQSAARGLQDQKCLCDCQLRQTSHLSYMPISNI